MSEAGDTAYQCVLCCARLKADESGHLACAVCGASYPVIAGVSVIVLDPLGLLILQSEQVADNLSFAQAQEHLVAALREADASDASISSLQRAFDASVANRRVFLEHFGPVEHYLEPRRGKEGPLALFTSYPNGWPLDRYLPYFYRDWNGTSEAAEVAQLFRGAIAEHTRADGGSLAVLGCGAGGLLYDLSELFDAGFGVDISIPTLLLAGHLLDGGEATLAFNFPRDLFPKEQARVRIRGPRLRREGISLVAANVNNLPFPPESVSCVATQYLIDLLNDQAAFAREVQRVLVPGGLWINFGLPLCQAAGDVVSHLDLPSFFERSGFEACEVSFHKSVQLDLSGLSQMASLTNQTHVFFVARKLDRLRGDTPNVFAEYFSGSRDPLFEKVPRLSGRFGFAVSREKLFDESGVKERFALEVRAAGGWHGFASSLRTAVPEAGALFLEVALAGIDGKRTVADFVSVLRERFAGAIAERDLVLFLRALRDSAFCELC